MNGKITTILVAALATSAVTTLAAPSVLRKSGDCQIQVAKAFDKTEVFTTGLTNADVAVECKFRADDNFFGAFNLIANPSFDNKSGKSLYVDYNVTFLDKAGEMVCCASQGATLKPNAEAMQLGSCLMQIPPEDAAKIASYRIVIYVSEARKKEN